MKAIKKIKHRLDWMARAASPEMQARAWAKLCLKGKQARKLRRNLATAAAMSSDGDEAMRRLKAEVGRIEACLRRVCGQYSVRLPAVGGIPRILSLARKMIGSGEDAIRSEEIVEWASTCEREYGLTVREVQMVPAALALALCEAFGGVCGDILSSARMQRRACAWVKAGGRGMPVGKMDAIFLSHALKICAVREQVEMHARLVRMFEKRGLKGDLLMAQAHGILAANSLRLDNLVQTYLTLEKLDWDAGFEAVSSVEIELRDDPAGVYGEMDDASRAQVRVYVEEIARALGLEEIAVVRHALRLAQKAGNEYGMQDLRATVCWYLAEDAGRSDLCAAAGKKCKLRRWVPDAGGRKTVALVSGCVAILAGLMCWVIGNPFLMIYVPPLAWGTAMQLIGMVYPRCVKPAKLLKMQMEQVPDWARTLVVLPVLISSKGRAEEMVKHMHALGCLEADANIDFLLLGDFRDANCEHLDTDGAILDVVRREIEALNHASQREKYFYLHRERSFRARDERWMGENRKRGALMDLNRLILGEEHAENAFGAENGCAQRLAGRYKYVITLDADTEYLPGTLQTLVGAMLHPLNRACWLDGRRRGYAVLQPSMLLTADALTNEYVKMNAGEGGVDSYPVAISDFYQDMTGHGCFAGKGIYDVHAFAMATEGKLNDDEILSHDLIEGILAGAASLGDVHFYDGCPDNVHSDLVRLNRWTRGDWQLIPVLFSRMPIAAVDRMKMLGNLLRSLYAPALLGLFIHSLWLDEPEAFLFALLLAFGDALVHGGMRAWKRALFRLCLLPAEAACMLDAALRTLWRLAFTHKHMMDWVPAADSGKGGGKIGLSNRIAAILLLPGLLRPFWAPAALALAALFWVGVAWAEDLASRAFMHRGRINARHHDFLMDIACRTWRFFDNYVPMDGCGLPPDNVQMDPPMGVAQRTSPTNMGLYLMSCLSAHELGILNREDMLARMKTALSTMEKLEKWRGQFYNWYDISKCVPLRPRYVSSVDSGNLAGALLLCAYALKNMDAELSRRMENLARGMNLAALYDEKSKLFFIGMDVESGRMSQAHYDLYASESRILSFAAMMMGQVSPRHWHHLSRQGVQHGRGRTLVSWSGTMFEYLMPELLLRSPENTLAGQSRRGVVDAQIAQGKRTGRPWGVSESGYYAFDLQLNYQYRAFGLRNLAMNGNAVQDVVAPYAAALALMVCPADAAENLWNMCEMGWCGDYGMFEAADYMHLESGRKPHIVRSYMAHHQGMALCSICNALRDDVLSRSFMEIPQARALRLLLQEKPLRLQHLQWKEDAFQHREMQDCACMDYHRHGRREHCAADGHLICGGGTTMIVTAHGAAFVWKDGWQMNRFGGNLFSRHEGMYVHLRNCHTGETAVMGDGGKVWFDAGSARFEQNFGKLHVKMLATASPEDGTVYQQLQLMNDSKEDEEIEITGCFAVALAPEGDMHAHPVFQNLFVESEYMGEGTLVFRRRQRDPGESIPVMAYTLSGGETIEWETSLERLVGRVGSLGKAGGIGREFSGTVGHVINPCAALRTRVSVKAGETACLHFALAMVSEEELKGKLCCTRSVDAPSRAMRLSSAQMRVMLAYAGISDREFQLMGRACVLLLAPKLRAWVQEGDEACPAIRREDIWKLGISGDLPILLVEIGEKEHLEGVRDVMRMHAYYKMMGFETDLVLMDMQENDYMQSVRHGLGELIASSHLNGRTGQPGGVFILEGRNMEGDSREAICRVAALRFDASVNGFDQLQGIVEKLHIEKGKEYAPMEPGNGMLPAEMKYTNGYGGFDGKEYAILLQGGMLPPAPWSNVVSSEQAGAIVSERGGGFAWFENSRSGRLTPFANDALREGWGWMFYLLDEGNAGWIRLLPGNIPMSDFCVHHGPGISRFSSSTGGIGFEVKVYAERRGVQFEICLKNEGNTAKHLRMAALVDWLMGTDGRDAAALRTWSRYGGCFASGMARGIGCLLADEPRARSGCNMQDFYSGGDMMYPRGLDKLDYACGGWTLHFPLSLRPGQMHTSRFLLGWAQDTDEAYAMAKEFRSGGALRRNRDDWPARLEKLRIETPDEKLNLLANGFLQAQILNARIRGRTGLYQPGGAYGFRDQLQDMLAIIHYEPERVRKHLLYCAARQFEAGDVMHWWHDPYFGVRTKISDDLLFLPYVTARYVRITGDRTILAGEIPFLRDTEIPENREDIYAKMQPTDYNATLHEHCMRAFRRAARTGEHGLCLMGSGDWNDGMNRVGFLGRGESIWLSEFMVVCALDYARISPDMNDNAWLKARAQDLRCAIEEHGWDGTWYLRAYADDGKKLGAEVCRCCRIDLISQAWAVLAGLDEERTRSAMNAAWNMLADEELGLVKLLTPPFDGRDMDPGYIAAYPPGVRENGAQYTHAACWMLVALARQGDGVRAHRLLEMLMPINHALTRQDAQRYRVEPYVMAADIYTEGMHAGRGGWTWYTGSAAWMLEGILALLGFERCGNRVRLNALLHDWPQAGLTLQYGLSSYRLISRAGVEHVELDGERINGDFIEMTDDGRRHMALFPPARSRNS